MNVNHAVHILQVDRGEFRPDFRAECDCGWRGPNGPVERLAAAAGDRHVMAPEHSTSILWSMGHALAGNRYSGDSYRAVCSCGWEGPREPLESEADEMATLHAQKAKEWSQ